MVDSDENEADFVASTLAPDGVGATRDWSAEVDSRLGLQLSSDITRRLSGVVQVVVEQRYDDTYTPTVEWANLELDVTPDLSVRAGRIVLPSFMVSEYRKVGYANPWVRPPTEVYGLVPVSNTDGVQVSYRSRYDPGDWFVMVELGCLKVAALSGTGRAGTSPVGIASGPSPRT